MKRAIVCGLLTLLVILCACGAQDLPAEAVDMTNDESLTACYDSYEARTGSFLFTEKTALRWITQEAHTDDETAFLHFLAQQFAAAELPTGKLMTCCSGSVGKRGEILLSLDASVPAEGFEIEVSSENISLRAADERGMLYGCFEMIKLLRANESLRIGGCLLRNTPEAAERTVLLDCGRKYFTAEWIKNYIREMAYMGYNTFEMHFSEDQGIRLDIWDEAYFQSPTGNDFTWACGGWAASWLVDEYEDYADAEKYLTAAEMIEILEVAKQYRIDVIPSFDTPMHCQYLRRRWNEYVEKENRKYSFQYDGKTYSAGGVTENGVTTAYREFKETYPNITWSVIIVRNDYGITTNTKVIDVTNPVARSLLEALLTDYAAFFRQYGCTEFNICGDEVAFYAQDGWDVYAQENLQIPDGSKYDTFVDYINEITDLLQEQGYRVRMFSDFVDRVTEEQHIAFDEDLELIYWWLPEDNPAVIEVDHFVEQDRVIYNGVQNYCYYVLATNSSGDDARDPKTVHWTWQFATADRLYERWNPTVFTHPVRGEERIAESDGGYFLIWTDYGAYATETEIWNGMDETGTYNVIERMWSNISKMWDYDLNERLDFEAFSVLCTKLGHYPGYTACDVPTVLPE